MSNDLMINLSFCCKKCISQSVNKDVLHQTPCVLNAFPPFIQIEILNPLQI